MIIILAIIILFFISELLRICSNFTGRLFENKSNKFLYLIIVSSIVVICSNFISFSTIFFLGKHSNIIILQCLLILGSVISVIFMNKYIIKEPVHIGSYIALCLIGIILIIHHIITEAFYKKNTVNYNLKKY